MSKLIPILFFSLIFSACAGLQASSPTAELPQIPTQSSGADCAPASSWTIEYHRTGGFGGFDQSLTLKSDGSLSVQNKKPALERQLTLPAAQVKAISGLLAQACPFETGAETGVCADCFTYELNIQMDGQRYTVQALDTTLTEELRPLITLLDEFFQATGQ